ncbi:polysaccharide pyruvyl transferase family protein [Nitrosomonas sp. Nm33]|uniref:polysaccharide pyruvyl transferase family protein n=1 Tax=Nitrosomonas sp. Nm33 TaxID=133724 RepID=UPI00089AF655|nr:polysaccharide pyruvyl transferase family protein [Nitrosomonas sp. Nm33]SDY20978.1 Polysaccharide pyruvyl transferase [Nitrosomonas sp. Nm33]
MSDHDSSIYEWIPSLNYHNFGDHLSHLIGCNLYKTKAWQRICSDRSKAYALLGSVLYDPIIESLLKKGRRPVFIGCGYRGEELSPELVKQSDIYGCRGPLTKVALENAGLKTSVTGDPAIILPLVVQQQRINYGKKILIPHILDPKRKDYSPVEFGCDELLQPETRNFQDLIEIISKIVKADFVLTGAMHAAIVAYAYGVPFGFFSNGYIDCKTKWADWVESISLPSSSVVFQNHQVDASEWYKRNSVNMKKPKYLSILKQYSKIDSIKLGIYLRAWIHDFLSD